MSRFKYTNENDRKKARTASKTKYMTNKSWVCPDCKRDYTLAGKWTHLKTQKHIKKVTESNK